MWERCQADAVLLSRPGAWVGVMQGGRQNFLVATKQLVFRKCMFTFHWGVGVRYTNLVLED